MTSLLRQAQRGDIEGMYRVRMSVRENRFVSMPFPPADYVPAIEQTGRGWVVEVDRRIVGLAIGNAITGNIWALFVDPAHERQGHGRRLHDTLVEWLFSQGLDRLWLSTDPRTRAECFYRAAGWQFVELLPDGQALYELQRAAVAGVTTFGDVISGRT